MAFATKNIAARVVIAGTIIVAVMGAPGAANAAPSGPTNASDTLNTLQANGFHVVLNKTGTAALDKCVVRSVRPGQTFSRTDSGAPGAGSGIVTTVTDKTVYLDLDC